MTRSVFSLAFLFSTLFCFGQDPEKVDSLLDVTRSNAHDTVKVKAFLQLGRVYSNVAWDTCKLYSDQGYELAKKINFKSGIANGLHMKAVVHYEWGNYDSVTHYLNQAITLRRALGDIRGVIVGHFVFGNMSDIKGDYQDALDHYLMAAELSDSLGDLRFGGNSYMGLANIMVALKNDSMAIKYYQLSIEMFDSIGSFNASWSMNNLADIYLERGELDKAMELYEESLRIKRENFDEYGAAFSIDAIGLVHLKRGEFENAKAKFIEALNIKRTMKVDEISMASSLLHLAEAQIGMNDLADVPQLLQDALLIARKFESREKEAEYNEVAALYEAKAGNYAAAFAHQVRYTEMRDSLITDENLRIMNDMQSKYDAAKTERKLAELEAKSMIEEAEKEKSAARTKLLYGGLVAAGILAIMLVIWLINQRKSNRMLSEQKLEIEAQNKSLEQAYDEIEEKNQDIVDSINYAKRIQTAILPHDRRIEEHLAKAFVLYLPKDIVAGDFYWLEAVGDEVLFAAADCTGHGVPGALVSVVCSNALNQAVAEHNLTDPGLILDFARKAVVERLSRDQEEVRDGMDISLCNWNRKTNKLRWAGAYNPLCLVRDGELLEYKADKQPVGKVENPKPFTSHTIQLHQNDILYIFSDGYADQFGGAKGKKLKTRNFRDLLVTLRNKDMSQQHAALLEFFNNWKSSYEQLDDVCVIGVRI